MFDIIFLSYDEPHADINWEVFRRKYPWALRVHGIQGIYEAHKVAATLAKTKMFWVVDADSSVLAAFDFSFKPTNNTNLVHVWYAYNPVNELVYGFGGLKLFPRRELLKTLSADIDVATSVFNGIVIVPEIASTTHFNNSNPLTTWRSAFRENVKLYLNLTRGYEEENSQRMSGWLTACDGAKYAKYSIHGAKTGQKFAANNRDNKIALSKINDYNWLKKTFEEYYGSS